MDRLKEKISSWIKDQVTACGAQGCVFGLSGGVDSSVVAALAKLAFPKNVLGLIMPCFSHDQDMEHAKLLAGKFDIPTKFIDLKFAYNQLFVQLEGRPYQNEGQNLAAANIKPRLRMATLYYFANKLNYLVLGTGNKSEAAMGYCTKYGDAGVDLLPLAELLKTQVRQLAKELGVPSEIIAKPPSAGLWSGQTDEAEMGLTYEELDKIILALEKGDLAGLDPKKVEKVKQTWEKSAHKRCFPPTFKI